MVGDKITVLIVDDVIQTRANIRRLLQFETDIEVVGEAQDGKEAIELAHKLKPNCILMDINMPIMNGIKATEQIYQELPQCMIIIISVQGEQEYLRKAMAAGARDYLIKPFSGTELANTIRQIWEVERGRLLRGHGENQIRKEGQVITIFGAKGGVGKTTIATNLAVGLGQAKQNVVLMDLDLQFGDIPLILNMQGKRSVAHWYREGCLAITDYLLTHDSGIKVLAAPENPEEGELIQGKQINAAIIQLKPEMDYVIIDVPQIFQETTLQSLELSDWIILVATPDLVNLKNLHRCLEVLSKLNLTNRVRIVINQAGKISGLPFRQFEDNLGQRIWYELPYDPHLTAKAVIEGVPIIDLKGRTGLGRAFAQLINEFIPVESESITKTKIPKSRLLPFFATKRG